MVALLVSGVSGAFTSGCSGGGATFGTGASYSNSNLSLL